ncbi:EAL domain-containing protein (plasmid) [Escherichia coli]
MTSSQPAGWTAAELAQAAARGQLDLHYQPLVDLRDHPDRWRGSVDALAASEAGLLPPGQFLPLAESFGLMPEIGAWVLGEACRQMHKWQDRHGNRSVLPSMCPPARLGQRSTTR